MVIEDGPGAGVVKNARGRNAKVQSSMEIEEESRVKENDCVVPGDLLGSDSSLSKGQGTCIRNGRVYSTLAGKVSISKELESKKSKPVITVLHPKAGMKNVPSKGSLVICQVININERQARVNMLSVSGVILQEPLHGVIRKEDVRAMEKDTVEIFHSFRPKDLVRARVIAYGEGQLYVLSTAENELGVVAATCQCGESMIPVSWCEMQCEKTGDREKRKVAKVVDAIPMIM